MCVPAALNRYHVSWFWPTGSEVKRRAVLISSATLPCVLTPCLTSGVLTPSYINVP